ncbi:MAG: hypothetical protein H6Q60_1548 [Oscillospiraceae bacterium]|nr:hypothetical protein [Oscillospiraceae bacterium]
MSQNDCKWYPFLRAAGGNWRNALFISCPDCPYRQQSCSGFLLAADADGKPLVMPVDAFWKMSGQQPARGECCGSLSRQAFEATFSLYLEWHTSTAEKCPLWQLCDAHEARYGHECP